MTLGGKVFACSRRSIVVASGQASHPATALQLNLKVDHNINSKNRLSDTFGQVTTKTGNRQFQGQLRLSF